MGSLKAQEIDKYLLQIFSNRRYFALQKDGNELYLSVRYPSAEERTKAEFIYKVTYDKAIVDGLLPSEELEELMKTRGIFKEEDELKAAKLEGQIEAQRVLLSKIKNVTANKDKVLTFIEDLTRQVNEIKYKKYSKLALSAEARASDAKHSYLSWSCCYTFDDSRYWDSYQTYLDDSDFDLKSSVLNAFLDFSMGLPQDVIREIARSNVWRARYIHSMKTSESLFGKAVADYSVDQVSLAYWSNFYQQIFEMLPDDRPEDAIIENDTSLDSYLDNLYKEREKEASHRRLKKSTRGTMSAFDAEEVIVTKAHEMYQEIKYDKPREAQRVKDRSDLRKRTSKSRR